ncbi:MAG: STAS domain-containing protein [Gemmatimonadota bacterium]
MGRADHLSARVEYDGLVCVLAVSGELDLLAAGKYADIAAAALRTNAERFVLDLSGLKFVDCGGARALAATAQAVPAGCPVIVRSVSPAARRVLELLGLSLELRGMPPGGPRPRAGAAAAVALRIAGPDARGDPPARANRGRHTGPGGRHADPAG